MSSRSSKNEFAKCDCQILGASTDSEFSHKAWFEKDLPEVTYPVLADTTQVVSRDFNVLGEGRGEPAGDVHHRSGWNCAVDGSV